MPVVPIPAPAAGRVFVARQPILDRSGRVFGYELLHRLSESAPSYESTSDEQATAHILTDGLLAIGLDSLTGGRRAFVNISRRFLLDGIPAVLPPGRVVFELDADTAHPDGAVMNACEALKELGYAIALDQDHAMAASPLLPLANYLKVDFARWSSVADRKRMFPSGLPAHAACIAMKIETAEQLAQAIAEGFTYFQGFYFGRPVVKEGSCVPPQQVAQLRLLAALNDPNLSVTHLEALIKPDPAICYRILRAVNSAGASTQATVHSIHEALVLLGRDTVRRWASLWALSSLGQDAHAELLAMATVRARCCELIAASTGKADAGAEGFLIGMCSLLDSILSRNMRTVVGELPLPEDVEAALLGTPNMYRHVLDSAIAYELGDWEAAFEHAESAGADPAVLSTAYGEALRWAYDLRRSTAVTHSPQ